MNKRIFITGISGQCGSILADHLLETKNYEIYGLIRRTSHSGTERINHMLDKITLVEGDITDPFSLIKCIEKCRPDTVVNLAAQSFVKASWDQSILTAQTTGLGVLNMLEAIRTVNPKIRFIQASSSELYGLMADDKPLNENSKFSPRSPYSCAKAFGHYQTINFRESYNMWACCAIMFNYESPRRSIEFVTKKIVQAACKIKLGLQKKLKLGNLEAKRDWTFCLDTCKALHLMMEMPMPQELVIASGKSHSVREFAELAFSYLDLNYMDHVEIDSTLFRPAEVPCLLGDSSRIRTLGWEPKINFEQLVRIMIDADMKELITTQNNTLQKI